MTTPNAASAQQPVRITPETPPQFPCWLRSILTERWEHRFSYPFGLDVMQRYFEYFCQAPHDADPSTFPVPGEVEKSAHAEPQGKLGGPGKCKHCGRMVSNRSFHEANCGILPELTQYAAELQAQSPATPSPVPAEGGLLPCPFCGEKPIVDCAENHSEHGGPDKWLVCCGSSHCYGNAFSLDDSFHSKAHACEAWNTRSSSSRPTAAPEDKPSSDQILDCLIAEAYEHKKCDALEEVYFSIRKDIPKEQVRTVLAIITAAMQSQPRTGKGEA